MPLPYTFLLPLLTALIISLVLVPAVCWLSFRTGKVSLPRSDRWHRQPTPSLGGIGMFLSFCIAITAVIFIPVGKNILLNRWSIFAAVVIMFAMGLYDDFKRLSPPVKIAFQILAAIIVIFFGQITIDFFRWPVANILLTFLWLVGITNAINLLDNMDGLAGGVALITSIFLSIFFWRSGNPELLVLSVALCGSILGFLVFNFPPAKIFMGDSGSMFLGFTLAVLAIARRTQASNIFAIVGVPVLILLLPILDTGLVSITRILRGQSPAMGGTDHTSHRLVAFGLSERQAVLVLYGIAIVSGLASIGIEALDYDLSLVLIPILLIVLSLFVAYLARMKVVTSELDQPNGVTQWLVNLTFKRRIFELIFDLLLIGISYYLAYWTSYGLNMTTMSMNLFLLSWPIILVVTYASLYIFRVYRGVWRYIGINDLLRFGGASLLAGAVAWLIIQLVFPSQPYTPDVFLLFTVYLLLGLSASRSSFLIMDRLFTQQNSNHHKENVRLYGAEDAGEIALRWIQRNPTMGYSVVGFLDDDALKWGSNIHGVNILGDLTKLEDCIEDKQISGVIATTDDLLSTPEGERLVSTCRSKGIWVRIMHLDFELTD